ncbi:MAG: methyltransferase domain-containing protein [Thermodesulfobacteriota bacterium]
MDFEITSHRPVIGRFIVAYKKLVRFLIAPYLKSVFEREHQISGRMTDLDGLMEEHLRSMSDSLGAMVNESQKALMVHIQEFDGRLTELNATMMKKFQWIDEHFLLATKKMDGIFEHADALFEPLDQKAETLAVRQVAVDEILSKLEDMENIQGLDRRLTDTKDNLLEYQRGLDERLTELNSTVVKKFQWIDEHFLMATKKMDGLMEHADALFEPLDQKAETLAVRQDSVDEILSRLKEVSEELRTRLENLEIEKFAAGQAELDGDIASLKKETEKGRGELAKTVREMGLDMITQKRRLEKILTELRKKAGLDEASMEKIVEVKEHLNDHSYFLFENRFRGTSEDIKNRQEVYLPLFLDLKKKDGESFVLDVGCGRGEFLELLNENSVPARGVDLNEEMVLVCKEKGLDVEEADAMAYLRGLKNNSLAGVIACQFIEHLPVPVLTEFVRLCHEKVKKGGRVVFETINPESVFAMKWFYMDMTHQKPIHPQAISFLMESTGFRNMEIKYLSPVATDLRLNAKGDSNMEKLDNLLFGPQDYAVIATK